MDEKFTTSTDQESLQKTIDRKVKQKIQSKTRSQKSAWFWVGMFGMIGWSIAIPILTGIVIGSRLDSAYPAEFSWTLTLIITFTIVGCLNAWYWVNKEIHRD